MIRDATPLRTAGAYLRRERVRVPGVGPQRRAGGRASRGTARYAAVAHSGRVPPGRGRGRRTRDAVPICPRWSARAPRPCLALPARRGARALGDRPEGIRLVRPVLARAAA